MTAGPLSAASGSVDFAALRSRAAAVADVLKLPLGGGLRHSVGNTAGSGVGSSIDFRDHRPYMPGDDPRHLDWRAYARTGHYTMKLYREELRPLIDVALDVSASMSLFPHKLARTLELVYFSIECGLRASSSIRLFLVSGQGVRDVPVEEGLAGELFGGASEGTAPALGRIPWRRGSLRVWISDLLYATSPPDCLRALIAGDGRAVILAPLAREESEPDWSADLRLEDCEGDGAMELRWSMEDGRRYRSAFAGHFSAWVEAGAGYGSPVALVDSEGDLLVALRREALAAGAVVPRSM